MERSRTIEKMGYGNGKVLNKRKYGNREWNGPEHCKKWYTGMEESRTMEKMGYGIGTVLNSGNYENQEWNSPEQ